MPSSGELDGARRRQRRGRGERGRGDEPGEPRRERAQQGLRSAGLGRARRGRVRRLGRHGRRLRLGLGLGRPRRRKRGQLGIEAEGPAQLGIDVVAVAQRILAHGGCERARQTAQAGARDLDPERGASRVERAERVARRDEGEVAEALVAPRELGERGREALPRREEQRAHAIVTVLCRLRERGDELDACFDQHRQQLRPQLRAQRILARRLHHEGEEGVPLAQRRLEGRDLLRPERRLGLDRGSRRRDLHLEAHAQCEAARLDARIAQRDRLREAPQRRLFAARREEREGAAQLAEQRPEIHAQGLEARMHGGLHPVPQRRHARRPAAAVQPGVHHAEQYDRGIGCEADLLFRFDLALPREGAEAIALEREAGLGTTVRGDDEAIAERAEGGLREHDLVAGIRLGRDARAAVRLAEHLLHEQALQECVRQQQWQLDAAQLGPASARAEQQADREGGGEATGGHRLRKVTTGRGPGRAASSGLLVLPWLR